MVAYHAFYCESLDFFTNEFSRRGLVLEQIGHCGKYDTLVDAIAHFVDYICLEIFVRAMLFVQNARFDRLRYFDLFLGDWMEQTRDYVYGGLCFDGQLFVVEREKRVMSVERVVVFCVGFVVVICATVRFSTIAYTFILKENISIQICVFVIRWIFE